MKTADTKLLTLACALASTTLHGTEPAAEADAAADLAKQLSNPVAALISVPLQNNVDFGIGANKGWRYSLNVQPVVPFTLNEDWNLISRTIVPFVHQADVFGRTTQSGLSDTVQSLFFSPKAPTASGWIWGAGPVLLLPTATDDRLGTEKWGAGPTAVALKQSGGWTYGVLANHLWSYAGESSRADVNSTFLNPFLSFTTKQQWTFTPLNIEATYDWENSQWTIPLSVAASKLIKLGQQPVSIGGGVRYYAEGPSGGPEWGLRFAITFLFPK